MATNGWRKLVAGGCLILIALVGGEAWAEKPGSPLTVDIKMSGKAVPGETATFDVTVTTQVDGDLTITLLPPAGAAVVTGELLWRGTVTAHGKKRMSLSVKLPLTDEQEFRAVANITGPNGARFGAGARYSIATKADKHSKERHSIREGEEIVEIPVPKK